MVEAELSRGTGTVKRPAPRGSVRVSSGEIEPAALPARRAVELDDGEPLAVGRLVEPTHAWTEQWGPAEQGHAVLVVPGFDLVHGSIGRSRETP
jgi:hypothetical protein